MAFRFKASKYKNAAAKVPKKDGWITDISVSRGLSSQGNHIKANCHHIAYNHDSPGGTTLGILPLNSVGRQDRSTPMLHAHADFVTDFDFSPFDVFTESSLLVTGSQDCSVKLWTLPSGPLLEPPSATATLTTLDRRVENVLWHPTAENILGFSSDRSVRIWDVGAQQEAYVLEDHNDLVQSFSWKEDGSLLATSCKDKKIRVLDPRAGSTVQAGEGHQNVRDSRVLWLGEKDMLLSVGFSKMRERQYIVWDPRNMGQTLATEALDSNTGPIMPLYDADTGMLFLAGKGDSAVRYFEVTSKHPYLTECQPHMSSEQVKGVAMVPKRAMDVMTGEVNRVLLLVHQAIIPLPYIVPRKSYRDFHEDLYPDTASGQPTMTAQEWMDGGNNMVTKISLDPKKRPTAPVKQSGGGPPPQAASAPPPSKPMVQPKPSTQEVEPVTSTPVESVKEDSKPQPAAVQVPKPAVQVPKLATGTTPAPAPEASNSGASTKISSEDTATKESPTKDSASQKGANRKSMFLAGLPTSKFRHLKCTTLHKSTHIVNIRNLNVSLYGECDGFHANADRVAVPLSVTGGQIAIFEVSQPGRLPDTGVPTVQNGTTVMDFCWDPFNTHRLAVAADATINIWNIPEGGLTETLTEPECSLRGHEEKIYCMKFHPTASDIMASASFDMSVRVWDLSAEQQVFKLRGHTDQIFSLAWSPDGQYLATVCKDGSIRIYNPRDSTRPLREGDGPVGARGARVVWACDGKCLAVTGFSKSSTRTVFVFNAEDLSAPLTTVGIDESTTILVPYYDEDSRVLFLTGKGDSQIFSYEVSTEKPYLIELATTAFSSPHQGVSYLPKKVCNVKDVEFAQGFKLNKTTLEPLSFTVPRIKMEYFQDDLFPDTRACWEPAMTAQEWLEGGNKVQRTISLQHADMKPLSEAPKEAPAPKKYQSYNPETYKTDQQKKEELMRAMDSKLELKGDPLPQDLCEGVDDDEWDD
ncbi:coronin-7-like [Branchiostoma floridae x Branchiostoma belcheri]